MYFCYNLILDLRDFSLFNNLRIKKRCSRTSDFRFKGFQLTLYFVKIDQEKCATLILLSIEHWLPKTRKTNI